MGVLSGLPAPGIATGPTSGDGRFACDWLRGPSRCRQPPLAQGVPATPPAGTRGYATAARLTVKAPDAGSHSRPFAVRFLRPNPHRRTNDTALAGRSALRFAESAVPNPGRHSPAPVGACSAAARQAASSQSGVAGPRGRPLCRRIPWTRHSMPSVPLVYAPMGQRRLHACRRGRGRGEILTLVSGSPPGLASEARGSPFRPAIPGLASK